MELNVNKAASQKVLSSEHAKNVIELLDENHGLAGPAFVRDIINNRQHYKSEVKAGVKFMDKIAGNNTSARYWVTTCAVAVVAGTHAETLGILPEGFAAEIKAYAIKLIQQLRDDVDSKKISAEDFIADFLTSSVRDTVNIAMLKGHNVPACINQDKFGNAYVRQEHHTGKTYISTTALRDYCHKRHTDLKGLLQELEEKSILVHKSKLVRMLAHTAHANDTLTDSDGNIRAEHDVSAVRCIGINTITPLKGDENVVRITQSSEEQTPRPI